MINIPFLYHFDLIPLGAIVLSIYDYNKNADQEWKMKNWMFFALCFSDASKPLRLDQYQLLTLKQVCMGSEGYV